MWDVAICEFNKDNQAYKIKLMKSGDMGGSSSTEVIELSVKIMRKFSDYGLPKYDINGISPSYYFLNDNNTKATLYIDKNITFEVIWE